MDNNHKYLLALESTFDDTAVAIIKNAKAVACERASGAGFYQPTGGVVPELASQRHSELMIPLINKALASAKIRLGQINAVAVACGPGLIAPLLVSTQTARVLSWGLNIPLIGVNHLEGHIVSSFPPEPHRDLFPAICLIVSGANTLLLKVERFGKYKLLGQTKDDAGGEAFDKIARALKLGSPGGVAIARASAKANKQTNLPRVKLPRPMINSGDLNFSFSGLKTAVLRQLKQRFDYPFCLALAREAQLAIVDVLVSKTIGASLNLGISNILVTGGVSANRLLRQTLLRKGQKFGLKIYFPPLELTGDNATMIGLAGWKRWENQDTISWRELKARPKLKLT